jgi:hypothetical protein
LSSVATSATTTLADAAARSGDERDFPVEAAAHGITMTLMASRSAMAR